MNTLDYIKNDPEMKVYQSGRYSSTARQVSLAMEISRRPCAGGECDEGAPCPRHQRTLQVVSRYLRLKLK